MGCVLGERILNDALDGESKKDRFTTLISVYIAQLQRSPDATDES